MPHFVFWSDLHAEFAPFDPPSISDFAARPDGVLIAGDLDTGGRHMDLAARVSRAYDCPVAIVLGNHEFYGSSIEAITEMSRRRATELRQDGVPVHLLEGGSVEIAGARISGATLWTDFNLHGSRAVSSMIAKNIMNDFRKIRVNAGSEGRPFTPEESAAMHATQRADLLASLSMPFDGPVVAMTHHMPSGSLVSERFLDLDNAAFASDLWPDIVDIPIDAWIYGHSHNGKEIEMEAGFAHTGRQVFVTNPRGYPEEKTAFDPLRMIHL